MASTVQTDVGVTRSENQDRAAIFHRDDVSLVILCDGMGGHTGGSHASRITVETFEDFFTNAFPNNIEISNINNWFKKSLSKARKKMAKYAGRNKELLDMGTTLTMALVLPDKIHVYNIGDSRTYIYNNLLHQITVDHNVRNYYIDKLGYSPEEAATNRMAAALTSAFGPKKKLSEISDFIIDRDSAMTLILTSDGIHDYIPKPTFEKIMGASKTVEEKGLALINHGIKGGSTDNLTVAILEVPYE